jgi:anti-sigma-K factor RskA
VNIHEYISSGIVESYVLGLASTEERIEFEQMCRQHPEVLQARIAFEELLEEKAFEHSIKADEGLKQKVFERIAGGNESIRIDTTPVRSFLWLKIAAAACFILLAGSIFWILSLQKKNNELTDRLNESGSKLAQVEEDLKMLQGNPAVKMVSMSGTDMSPQSYTTVYWDTTSHDVFLLVNNLPQPASDQQYQLWALLNGQPIDMGMLEITEKPLQLYRMKNVQSAQAFAITLEKKGGSTTPQGSMYVMGKL